jgi:hypothetical protein
MLVLPRPNASGIDAMDTGGTADAVLCSILLYHFELELSVELSFGPIAEKSPMRKEETVL